AAHQAFEHGGLVFRLQNEMERIDDAAQHVLDDFRVAIHEAARGEDSRALKRDRQLRQVAQVGEAAGDQRRGERVAEMRRRNAFVEQRLAAHRLVAENSEADAVALGVEAPVFQRESREHPAAAAGAGDRDGLAFQVGGRFDVRRRHDVADELVDDACDVNQVHALGRRSQGRAGGGAGMKLRLSRRHGRHAHRAAAYGDEGQVQTVAAKEPLILGDVHGRFALAERARGHDDLGQRLGGAQVARGGEDHGAQRKKKERFGFHRFLRAPTVEKFRSFEQSCWENIPDSYHQAFGQLTTQTINALLDAARVKKGVKFLDIATGPGYVAAAAAKRGATVLGVDFSRSMVEQARRLHGGIDFREGDAEALPLGNGLFDAAAMNFGILHLGYPEKALVEAHRVLRSGGRHGEPRVELPEGPPFFRYSDPAECERGLIAAGFQAPTVTKVAQVWRLPAGDGLFNAMLESTVRTAGLLRAQKPTVLNKIRDAMRAAVEKYTQRGVVNLPMPALVASSAKP